MIRALIVDDEPLARGRIAGLLGEHDDFAVIAEASHGEQAIGLIRALKPDVVFLDVQMPQLSGLDVVQAIGPDNMPQTVFVTAFDEHAVQAFDVEAVDYVLKPFDDERFARVLTRVRARRGERQAASVAAALRACSPPRLVARLGNRLRVIPHDEIDWISAAGDYAEVHAGKQVLLIDETIAALVRRLPADQFARVHRSTIVRLDRIAELAIDAHGDGVLRLGSGHDLRVSRRFRAAVDGYLGRR